MSGLSNDEVKSALQKALTPYLQAFCEEPGKVVFDVDVSDDYAWGSLTLAADDRQRIGSSLTVKNAMNDALRVLCGWIDPEVTRTSFGVVLHP